MNLYTIVFMSEYKYKELFEITWTCEADIWYNV